MAKVVGGQNSSEQLRQISSESFTLGIGVGSQAFTPPLGATHMILGRGTLGSLSVSYRYTVAGGVAQEILVNPSNALPMVVPIPRYATAHTFIRSGTTAADTYTITYFA